MHMISGVTPTRPAITETTESHTFTQLQAPSTEQWTRTSSNMTKPQQRLFNNQDLSTQVMMNHDSSGYTSSHTKAFTQNSSQREKPIKQMKPSAASTPIPKQQTNSQGTSLGEIEK